MCIIIAKNAKVAMPSEEILRTCFKNNPDGAGFMLASKGKVFGFKGFMTADELLDELAKAEKRFGNLDRLPVVIHCRIKTHGKIAAGNTHPFPLGCGYREMRKTEWVAKQGFAHNGIIYDWDRDPDIAKHQVSDTMVFAKKVISPIAKYADIATDSALLDLLHTLANSKLCFLSGKGKLATRGDFVTENGILYSNKSYKEERVKKTYSTYDYKKYDKYGGYTYKYHDEPYFFGDMALSDLELNELRSEIEDEEGFYPLAEGTRLLFNDHSMDGLNCTASLSIDEEGNVYAWNDKYLDFYLFATADEYYDIILPEDGEGGEDDDL